MRQAGASLLPESVRKRRSKAEFSSLVASALKHLIPALGGETAFDSFSIVQRGWVDPERLRQFYRARISDPNANVWPVWSAIELELWARECLP